jgi:hypothetical protein
MNILIKLLALIPYLFGMPFLLAYCVIWVVITTVLMTIIYKLDPKNKEGEAR